MTVHEILLDAYKKVQEEHGIAIKTVEFDLVNASTYADEMYAVTSIEVEAIALSRQESKK